MYYITLISLVVTASVVAFYAGYRHGFKISWSVYMTQVNEAIDKFIKDGG